MEVLIRDWKLLSEVSALNLEPNISLRDRYDLQRLLDEVRSLEPGFYQAVNKKLQVSKPKAFAPWSAQTNPSGWDLESLRRQEIKTELDWWAQGLLEAEDQCLKVDGVQALLDLEMRRREAEPPSGWEIRWELDLDFMRNHYYRHDITSSIDFKRSLNAAIADYDDLGILKSWLKLNNTTSLTLSEKQMEPLIAWQTLKAVREQQCSFGSWTFVFKRNVKYIFVFFGCTSQQAYRIIDSLERDNIQSVVVRAESPGPDDEYIEQVG